MHWFHPDRQRPSVVVLGAGDRPTVKRELNSIVSAIESLADVADVNLHLDYDFSDTDHDLVIVLGGDGSILQTARLMGENQTPVLGVNCGWLGFLAALSPERFLTNWPEIVAGKFSMVEHLMLRCSLVRRGEVIADRLGLNETAVLGGPPYRILDIDLYVDSELATTYRCDGLILCTPVGSTAHNLSAGGPIVRKDMQAFIVSPISPHTLTYRPVVDSADREFELTVNNPNASTSVVVDGRVLSTLEVGDRVHIRRSTNAFKMLAVAGQNDYRTLREKLGWGGSLRVR
ncbi:MAG: NAD(+)/NADH kinase [Planctomycetota bacterium]